MIGIGLGLENNIKLEKTVIMKKRWFFSMINSFNVIWE